jgi:hypothetical protein
MFIYHNRLDFQSKTSDVCGMRTYKQKLKDTCICLKAVGKIIDLLVKLKQ